ncbi:SDR family oxidoreductase [Nocardioides sp. LHG3406-4]|uniref:SDR family oxidoreductase n=1 Tax=Nocardioides sp. LHG3406-4 TaxID=2804575 RepID=UPI003CF8CA15
MSEHGLAVVTGASSGVGAAVAQELHRSGRPLLMLARREEEMARLGLARAMAAAVDVRDLAQVRVAIDRATERFGPVEILVNNAGIMPLGDVAGQPMGDWQATLDVNCVAVAGLTQAVLPAMMHAGRGTIVMVTSLGARQVFEHHAAYCASKAAVHALADAVRLEAGPHGVRVVEIAPGMVDTSLIDSTASEDLRAEYLRHREHVLDPAEVAEAVRWACDLPQHVCVRELQVAHTRQR